MGNREWARIDITGQRFGLLTAVSRCPVVDRRTRWLCKCDCGKQTKVVLEALRGGTIRSCGCLRFKKRYPKRDFAGQKLGRLFVAEFVGRRGGDSLWKCRCDCGNERVVSGYNLYCGASRSCGCTIREALLRVNTKHGKTGTAEYRVWSGMLTRCYNVKDAAYKHYGGRGIKVCRRWRGDGGFENFLTDMGERPFGLSLERCNVNLGYSYKNCCWASRSVQARNKRSTCFVRYQRKKIALVTVCEQLGLSYCSMRNRLRTMSFSEAIAKPIRINDDTTVAARSRKAGLSPTTVYARLRAGWQIEKALTVPVIKWQDGANKNANA